MARRYVPTRGDAVWITFNPQAGHEQAGRRPALVVSPASYNGKVGLAILCPITSQVIRISVRGGDSLSYAISVIRGRLPTCSSNGTRQKKPGTGESMVFPLLRLLRYLTIRYRRLFLTLITQNRKRGISPLECRRVVGSWSLPTWKRGTRSE